MRTSVVFFVLSPAVLLAQATQQGMSPEQQKWRDEQATIATANAASLAKRREQMEKTIVDLQRREASAMQGYADVFGDSDPQGTDARFIKEAGEKRRQRIEADDKLAAHLDSVRRAGSLDDIVRALTLRKQSLDQWHTESQGPVGILRDAKDMLRRWDRSLEHWKAEDKPSNPPDRKAFVKAHIDNTERFVRLARGIVDFETKRGDALRNESAALGRQLDAAAALMK